MKFKLMTLFDITKTNARRGDDQYKQKQQQNFLTTVQTISLRANPIIDKDPVVTERNVSNYFGTKYKGKQKVWELEFEFESVDQHSIEKLILDFNYVPIITELDETVNVSQAAFITENKESLNIIFEHLDK